MYKISAILLSALLASTALRAAESPTPAAAPGATPESGTAAGDLDAQLAAARQKLELAAREVARLSSQLGQTAMQRIQLIRTRATLGIQLQPEPAAKDAGAVVSAVSPGGPAAEAGLAVGDVIVALNGAATTGPHAAREVVDGMTTVKPDTQVTVKVVRDGKSREFQVTPRLGMAGMFPGLSWGRDGGPDGPGGPGRPGPPRPPGEPIGPNGAGPEWQQSGRGPMDRSGIGAEFAGMELADLSPALGQYFGASQGVLVIRVPTGGTALKLQDGDVILNIDGRVPENGTHATRILRSYQPGERMHLKVMRQKKTVELEVTLPEGSHPMHRGLNARPAGLPGPGVDPHPPGGHGPGGPSPGDHGPPPPPAT